MAGSAILCTRRISVRSSPAIRYLTGHREGRSREFYGGGSGVRRGRWWLVEGSSGSDDATWTNCRQIGTVNEPRPLGSLCAPVAAAAERAMPGSRPYNPVCQSAAYVPMQLVIPNLGGDPDQVRDQGCSDRAGGRRGRNPIGSVLLAAFGGALGALQTLRLCEAEGQQYSGERHEHIAARLPPSLIIDLQAILGDGDRVVTDDEECKVHAIPWNSYHDSPACPGAVVYPRSTEEVLEIVKTCARYKVPLIPYGGGTSLEGHTTTPKGGVSIDMNQMKAIKRLSVEDMDVTVEPGIGWIELNAFLRPYGLFFPLDPGPGATIGGMCATRCSGSLAVRYGTMRDNVISIKAVTANGDVVKTASRARKSSAGYDLTRLLIGSEGTLGVITEITLKLQRIPEASTVAMCTFPSIKDAADVAIATMHAGIQVSRVELLDEVMIKGLNIGSGRSLPERPTLMFEFIGTESSVKEQTKCVEGIVSAHGGSNFVFAESAAEKEALWRMRKEALWSAATLKPESEPMVTVGEHRQAHFHSYLSSFFVNSLDSSYTKEANNSFESYLLP
ncbi:hypothetical protein CBR_g48275 [Chara braunii]|uniref:D-lactate dehydrogenase (cytochrome) n=1 Tax=Chara braunii TaxID=69332 RepID=A0A388M2E4_CHABU|nr:hypothetical protein CBR_g48275 [Chara braunii]|eukprot:GBG88747.1 hypothetical protein CBR_g48275 [Chara braunii]